MVALGLFVWNRLRLDVVALVVLALLVVPGLVLPEQAVRGFSNEATITVAGAADYLAAAVLDVTRPLGPHGVLAAFFLLTMATLHFVVAVMFGASNAFMTPIGHQTNVFVYAPGGYRFTIFTRAGMRLGLLIAAAVTLVIPQFFPFR